MLIIFLMKRLQVLLLQLQINLFIKGEIMTKQKLAERLHKTNIKKFGKQKVHSSFKDNIGGAHLADMQLINKCN